MRCRRPASCAACPRRRSRRYSSSRPRPCRPTAGGMASDGSSPSTDLVRGASVTTPAALGRLEQRWGPPQEPWWWSPTPSGRCSSPAFDQASPPVASGSSWVSTARPRRCHWSRVGCRPPSPGGSTTARCYGLLDLGPGTTRLEVRTWSLGEQAWAAPGTVLSWRDDVGGDTEMLQALLSPDGQRLLLTSPVTDPDSNALDQTDAMMFDPRTGAQLGMPLATAASTPRAGALGPRCRGRAGDAARPGTAGCP